MYTRNFNHLAEFAGSAKRMIFLAMVLSAVWPTLVRSETREPGPYKVLAEDVTGDGVKDLIVAFHDAGVVAVEPGQKDFGFGEAVTNDLCRQVGQARSDDEEGVYNIDLGDVDQDGLPDMLIGCRGNFALLARNSGAARFQLVLVLKTESSAKGVHFADLDGDSDLDLLYTGRGRPDRKRSGGKLYIRENLGQWKFKEARVFEAGSSAYFVTTADLNEDGYRDILVPNERDTTATYWLSSGQSLLSQAEVNARTLNTSGRQVNDVRAADLNGDGHLDVLTANWISSTISLFMGLGDGTFEAERVYAGGPDCVFFDLADYDGDGDEDFAVTHWRSDFISVFLNNGRGEFKSRDFRVGQGNYGIDSFDANQDGHLDLITANFQDEGLSLLLGQGDGSFRPAQNLTRFVEKKSGKWLYRRERAETADAN